MVSSTGRPVCNMFQSNIRSPKGVTHQSCLFVRRCLANQYLRKRNSYKYPREESVQLLGAKKTISQVVQVLHAAPFVDRLSGRKTHENVGGGGTWRFRGWLLGGDRGGRGGGGFLIAGTRLLPTGCKCHDYSVHPAREAQQWRRGVQCTGSTLKTAPLLHR